MNKSSSRFFANSFGLRILPNIILCLSIGFLGSLVFKNGYQEIKVLENEDVFFQAAKLVLGISFLVGFIMKRLLHGMRAIYMEYSTLVLLIAEMVSLNSFSSGIIQVDYIFYTDVFIFFASLNAFVAGLLISRMKNFRLWAFLSGGTIYIIYTLINPEIVIKPETYIMPLVFVMTLELTLFSIVPRAHNAIQKEGAKTYPINNIFFYSSLSLFICHSILYYVNGKTIDSFVLGTGLGLLLFNIIFHYGFLNSLLRWKYLTGRGILIVSLILTMHLSRFELASGFLLFLDMACIAIYRPSRYKMIYIILSILGGFALYALTYFLNLYYLRYEFRYSLVFGFVLLVWIPYLFLNSIRILNKVLTVALSFALSAYFFSPLPYDYKMNFIKTESLKPIPYLLSSLGLNEENFVYFNVNLPFKNQDTLPKKNTFRNKMIILGLSDNLETTLTYLYHLNKNGFPFVIFQDKKARQLTNKLIDFDSIEYPLFRIYFPRNTIPTLQLEKENASKSESWEMQHIEGRIRNLEQNEDIADILNNTISYSNGTLKEYSVSYRNKFYNSYKSYSEFYFKIGDYDRAVQMAGLAFRFDVKEDSLLDTAYHSLLRITTEKEQIPVMRILLTKNRYKENIIKRLYPMLLTLKRKEEALEKISELIEFYTKDTEFDHTEDLKNLKIEKAKIYLQFSNIREAEEIIMTESRKNNDSVVWQKLMIDLATLKENLYKPYQHPGTNVQNLPRSIE